LGLFDPGQGPWFVKDPRVSLLLPLWDRFALQTLPLVICVRDPREVASSLLLRNDMPPRRALAVWFAYLSDLLTSAEDRPTLVIDFESLVTDPVPVLESLGQFLYMFAGAQTHMPTVDVLQPLVEPALRRNRAVGAFGVAASEVDEAVDAYLRVAKAHGDPNTRAYSPVIPAWAQDVLEEAREIYRADQAAKQSSEFIAQLEQELRHSIDPIPEILALEEELRQVQVAKGMIVGQLAEIERTLTVERSTREATEQALGEARVSFEQEITRFRNLVAELEALNAESANRAEIISRKADLRVSEAREALNDSQIEQSLLVQKLASLTEAIIAKEEELIVARRLASVSENQASELESRIMVANLEVSDISTRLDDAIARTVELMNDSADLRRRLAASNGPEHTQSEVTAVLTDALAGQQTRANLANANLRLANEELVQIKKMLVEEKACSARLMSSLNTALTAGNDLTVELDGIKASRTFRLRHKFSRDRDDDIKSRHFVPSIEASLITEAIAKGLFDPQWYTNQNADVEECGADPTHHYFTQGWREARHPNADSVIQSQIQTSAAKREQECSPLIEILTRAGLQEPDGLTSDRND
jgi:hypothetical protein